MIGSIAPNSGGRNVSATIAYISMTDGKHGDVPAEERSVLIYTQNMRLEEGFFADDMKSVIALNTRGVKDPTRHMSISFAAGEKPTDKQCKEINKSTLDRMGYKDCQAISYLAKDNGYYHLHTYVNRVQFNGKVANDSFSMKNMERSMRECEIKYNFQRVNGRHWSIHNDKPIETFRLEKQLGYKLEYNKEISDKAIAIEKNTGRDSFETFWLKSDESNQLRQELKNVMDKGGATWNDVHKCFDKYNLELVKYVDEKRKRDGFVIVDKSDPKARMKASQFDANNDLFKNKLMYKTIGLPYEPSAMGLVGNNIRGYVSSISERAKSNSVYNTYSHNKSQLNSQLKQLDQQRYGNLTPEQTLKLAINVVQKTATNFTDKKIIDLAVNFGGHAREDLKTAFNGLVDAAKVIELSDSNSNDRLYSSSYMIRLEQGNIDRITQLSGSHKSNITVDEVNSYLDKWQTIKGFDLSVGQRNAIVAELCDDSGVLFIQGDPGTGKTTLTEAVEDFNRDVLMTSGRGHYTIGVAFTGKAAAELSETLGHNAFTINSFINKKFEPVSVKYLDGKNDEDNTTIKIPVGHSILLKIDEASFVGSKHFEQLLNKRDELEKTFNVPVKIEFGGDTKQKQAIAAGNPFEVAQELAIAKVVTLKDINRQRDTSLHEVATLFNASDKIDGAQKGFDKLQQMGCVAEVSDSHKLMQKTVNDYFNLVGKEHKYIDSRTGKESSAILKTGGIIVSTNAERIELNNMVRAERIQRGEINDGVARQVMTPVSFSAEKLTNASNFSVGQHIQFHDGKTAEVIKVNLKNNSLDVRFEDKKVNGEIATRGEWHEGYRTVHLNESHDKISVFELKEQNFSVGDKIVCLQNTDWCKNGSLYEIKRYDKENNVVVHGPNNTEINFGTYNKYAHAYALTTEKSQGATWDFAVRHAKLVSIRSNNEWKKSIARGVTHNSENVGITRARYVSLVNTDSVKLYRSQLKKVDRKDNTLNKNGTLKLALAETKIAFEKSIKLLDKDTRIQVSKIIKSMSKGVAGRISYKDGQLAIDKMYLETAQMKATLQEKYITDRNTLMEKYGSARGSFKDYVVIEANKGNGEVIREVDKFAPNHPMVNNNKIETDKPIQTKVVDGEVSFDSKQLLTPDKSGAEKPSKGIHDIKMVQERNGDVECRWKDTNAVAFKITRDGLIIKEHSSEAIKAALELSATANNGVVKIRGSEQYEKLASEIAKEVSTLKIPERERNIDRSMAIQR